MNWNKDSAQKSSTGRLSNSASTANWVRPLAATLAAACLVAIASAANAQATIDGARTPAVKNEQSEADKALAQKMRQNAVSVAFLQGQRPAAPDAVAQLGPNLFGDKVNLYNGSVSIEQTDVALEGNSRLRVALDRQHAPGRQVFVRGALADWDLNTPRIEGSFADAEGFVPALGTPSTRCSGFNTPPNVARFDGGPAAVQDFAPDEYWHGTQLVIPGQGSQEILRRTQLPNADASWTLVTRGMWKLSCLNTLRNGPGQGFVARSPEGVTYYFDWLASRATTPLRKGDALLGRLDVYLMATRVVDRHNNSVVYDYDPAAPLNLRSITASDGRTIGLRYVAGRLDSVTDNTRTWSYRYAPDGSLQNVVLPDQSRWTFSLQSLIQPAGSVIDEQYYQCDSLPSIVGNPRSGWMQHPSGALLTLDTNFVYHGRTHVQRACTFAPGTRATNGSVFPHTTVSQSLVSKTISGPGMEPMVWEYNASNVGAFAPCATCGDRKAVVVKEPGGALTRHTYGIRWRVNDGQLLKVEQADRKTNVYRTQDIRYRVPTGEFPDSFGSSVRLTTDLVSTLNRPEDRREISQQGVSFVWEAEGSPSEAFDVYARPVATRSSSSLGYARRLVRTYRDFPATWVMGQTASVTERQTGLTVEQTEFHADSALPSAQYAFGRFLRQMTYHPNGTLWELSDGAGKKTRFEDYKLGQPQRAVFADTTEARQTINNLGVASDFTNEALQTTRFGFDSMGRVNRVTHPAETWGPYCDTTMTFRQSLQPDRGLEAGHWRQTVSTCNEVIDRWFDGLWRVRLEWRRDAANLSGTGRMIETRYDAAGNTVFESYPQRNISSVNSGAVLGVSRSFDPLQRLVRTEAASERGPLVTSVSYLANFQKQVTNPRGRATTMAFQAFDQPSEEVTARLWLPEAAEVMIDRDVFGKARSITRAGPSPSGYASVTRSYFYNGFQQLCKTVEPETGATVQGYDAAGNVAWRASGRPASAGCNLAEHPSNVVVQFTHDPRNRLESTTFGDQQSPPITRSYTPDGLLEGLVAGNQIWSYGYNNRRLLVRETLNSNGQNLSLNWGIDVYGHRASMTYPNGTPLAYVPNALGQPTQVSSGGYLLAGDIRYHPNGAVSQYVLSNQILHTQSQSVRGLPESWRHGNVVDHTYNHDEVGNVTAILDSVAPSQSRAMLYDGLDRLRFANGAWGSGEYRYDAVDNLRYSQLGTRTLDHQYDTNNRLVGVTGSLTADVGYDANGNVSLRAGQTFRFDIGNRMLSSSTGLSFAYDGHGRRTQVSYANGANRLQMFSQDGKLMYGLHTAPAGVPAEGQVLYVHLQDRLIAEFNATAGVLHYVHTDALGTPVVKTTDTQPAQKVPGSERWHEPYGLTDLSAASGVGFTGHFFDRETELVYMQQRYYDPVAGRFLSVDPVTTDAKTGDHFNRYVYAENNPFRFVDPDGRAPVCVDSNGCKHVGNPQSTGTPGHDTASARVGAQASQQGAAEVHYNRSLAAATGNPAAGQQKPDVTVIWKDGKVSTVEVVSNSQTVVSQAAKGQVMQSQLAGIGRAGAANTVTVNQAMSGTTVRGVGAMGVLGAAVRAAEIGKIEQQAGGRVPLGTALHYMGGYTNREQVVDAARGGLH